MSSKIIMKCVVCAEKRHPEKFVPFIDAASEFHEHQPLCKRCCGRRSLVCPQCGKPLTVFIDGSTVCPDCVKRHLEYLWSTKRAQLEAEYQSLARQVPPADIEEFLKRVQIGLEEPNAEPERCWIAALAVYSYRFGMAVTKVVTRVRFELADTKSLVVTLLPSGDHAKRFKPSPSC